jgi:putative phage-type endonuclease
MKWLEERQSGIGGSDIAAIVGISPFKSALGVYLEKTSPVEELIEDEVPDYIKRGNFLEDGVLQWYEDRVGVEVRRNSAIKRDPVNPILMGTADGFVYNEDGLDYIVEAKTVHFSQAPQWGEQGSDRIPDYYLTQVTWYMGIYGVNRCDVVALIGGDDLRVYTVEFDEQLFQMLVEKAHEFWNTYVIPKKMPDLDGTKGAKEWLSRMFPREQPGTLIDADDKTKQLCIELFNIRNELKKLGTKEEEIVSNIKFAIGDNEGVTGAFGKVTWKKTKDTQVFDAKAALEALVASGTITAEQYQEVEKKYTKTRKGSRRFTPSFKL